MRPRRLELEGFATFRDRVVLDFDGFDLVAFTGPTGAGKSSLIDAITFALYGSVARYGDTRKVAPVIHQLANEARVRLDFDAGGQTYIATRVVRRRPSKSGAVTATTREARLERIEPDGTTTVLAGEVRELNPAIEELLGLDFTQFTRTIVLPQGEFAAFLRDDQADRDRLLQRLLDLGIYERVGQLARASATAAATEIGFHQERRKRIAPPTDDELEGLAGRLSDLEALRPTVAEGAAELERLTTTIEPLRQRVRHLDDALSRLGAIAPPEGLELDDVGRRLAERTAVRTGIEERLMAARADRDAAQRQLDELPDKSELGQRVSVIEQLAEARIEEDELRVEATQLADQHRRLTTDHDRLERAVGEADLTLRHVRRSADAASWTAALEVGHPCPVCHREVAEVPDHDVGGALTEAEDLHQKLVAEARVAEKELTKVAERERVVAKEIVRSAERIELLEHRRRTWDGPAEPDAIAAVLVVVGEIDERLRATTAQVAELETDLWAVSQEVAELDEGVRRQQAELASGRDSVADLGPPTLTHRSLADDRRTLAQWAAERATALAEEREAVAVEGRRVAERRRELSAELVAAGAGLGIEAEPDALLMAVVTAAGQAEAQLEDARRRRRADEEDAARIGELESRRRVDEALGRHLRVGGFGSWLLAEAVDAIVAKATHWLLELSNRQYSLLAGERTFAIVDHANADEVRDVRTLSGGETFLASLALALALADSIAELAPVDAPGLESMFLDEGFGTLDPATLDVVASAIEELASSGRMIGLVTHVADLAERMPARFQVSKGPTTSTVELVTT